MTLVEFIIVAVVVSVFNLIAVFIMSEELEDTCYFDPSWIRVIVLIPPMGIFVALGTLIASSTDWLWKFLLGRY